MTIPPQSRSIPTPRRARRRWWPTATRLLDALPGGIAWLSLLAVGLTAVAAPYALLTGIALVASYAALRFVVGAMSVARGLTLIRHWNTLDWRHEYDRRRTTDSLRLDKVHHLVLIPAYREPIGLLRRTLEHLSRQHHAQTAITVVLALECADPDAQRTGADLQAAFASDFAELLVTYHPVQQPDEMQCKAANLAWALRQAQRHLIHQRGLDPDHIVVTSMDADTIWHSQHFASLSTLFATDPQRYQRFWQAPLRYHANVWTAHPLLRILHATASAWELAYLAGPWHSLPMSSYALSLRLLNAAGGWAPDVIADEWHLYLTSYFQQRGQQNVQPIYLPVQVQAVTGETIRDALHARYRQTFRHAWGAKEIGYTVAQMARHPAATPLSTIGLLLRVAYDNILASAGWIVLFIGTQLPLLLHPSLLRAHISSPPLIAIQIAVAIVTGLTIAAWLLDQRLRPPRSSRTTPPHWRDITLEVLSVPLVAVLTIVGVTLPVLHAQTRMLRGKTIRFDVTQKQ